VQPDELVWPGEIRRPSRPPAGADLQQRRAPFERRIAGTRHDSPDPVTDLLISRSGSVTRPGLVGDGAGYGSGAGVARVVVDEADHRSRIEVDQNGQAGVPLGAGEQRLQFERQPHRVGGQGDRQADGADAQ
jgi:hypothetical protein